MERISESRSKGLNRNGLRTWAMLIAISGLVGRGLIQHHVLGMSGLNNDQLLQLLNDPDMMVFATVSLVLQVVETCAVPMFALMLAEGFVHTADLKGYALRVTGCALLSEIPFDLLMRGRLLDMSSQNPVFGLVLGLVLLFFFRQYEGKGVKRFLIRLLVVVVAAAWAGMLRIDMGIAMVLMVWPMYAFREKPMYRNLMAATMAVVSALTSMFFIMAPMGCLMLHIYNGEKGEEEPSKILTYLAYPVILLALALVAMYLL
ncbi:MAG: hypothetical protein IJX04_06545 [Oscillospiraceae bacterium]|nr:hypothetical protein [Oscillospiraceae bacterium]